MNKALVALIGLVMCGSAQADWWSGDYRVHRGFDSDVAHERMLDRYHQEQMEDAARWNNYYQQEQLNEMRRYRRMQQRRRQYDRWERQMME